MSKKETCKYCGGVGRIPDCPEYTPFATKPCYSCRGKGHVMVEGKEPDKPKTDKDRIKEAIKNDPFNVW